MERIVYASVLCWPIHGSVPDIAGQAIANPLGAILSFALCLRYTMGLTQDAQRLEKAVERAVAGGVRTGDIAVSCERAASTTGMGDAVPRELEGSIQ
jgi:3-isopropylmalate dehydrogenase